MIKNSLLKNFFSSGVQAISVQVLGIVFFYVTSLYLPKEEFGIINWATAVSALITTLLSFGLDQVVVRRIAASKTSDWAAVAYLAHAFLGSVVAFGLLMVIRVFFDHHTNSFSFLPWFFAVQAITYIAMPLKQYLNAKQNFTPYAFIAMASNLCKIILAIVLVRNNNLSVYTVFLVLFSCAFLELALLVIYIKSKTDLRLKFKLTAYSKLLRESFPQYISVLFDSGNSRADWILLGMLTTNALTAEYAFAYKAFEMARLPIVIIAPIILNLFSRMLFGNSRPDAEKQAHIASLHTVEIFISMLLPLCLNILWSPVVDVLLKGKYGTVNAPEFMILSVCIPAMLVINLFWTLCFSAKKYKEISFITIISAIINILLNLTLIPFLGKIGAATAFFISTAFQLIYYYKLVKKHVMTFPPFEFLIFFAIAAASYLISINITSNVVMQLLTAVCLYLTASVLLKRVHKQHLNTLKLFLKK